jgi:mannose-1-phosphate guanylyltransferase / phosphomannomutase
VIGPGVKVYPFKTVEAGATINSSIVWESKGARSLFGRDGVVGLANVDITPELATRVAMAWGSSLKKESTVVASRDSSRASRMLKRAFMAGLNAAGVNVVDLEVAPVPVTRFLVRQALAVGGVTIRLLEEDPQSVVFRFFNSDGLDLVETAQRKIERQFQREDFRRVFASEIGDIDFPPRALEQYTAALGATVKLAQLREAGFKLVVDYGYGSTSFVMPNVLSHLGGDVLGVNPYASTRGAMGFDRQTHAAHVAELVRASGASIGAVLDPDGEHLTLVDDRGRVLDDATALHAFLRLVGGHLLGDAVALPVNVSQACEALVKPHGVRVRYTKTSTPALMEAATEPGVGFAASTDGGYILPGFLPAFDAAASLVKVLELLALEGSRLSEIVDDLPRVHVVRETVVTPWEQKGVVMRRLVEQAKDHQLVLVDGVKVLHPGGWALALPDPEEPLTTVWAEAATDAEARRLAQEYARRIRQMLR